MTLIESILQSFEATIKGQSTQIISNAQCKLKNLQSNPQFVGKLMQILQQNSLSQNILKATAAYFKTIARNVIKRKIQADINEKAEQMLSILGQTNISLHLRKIVSDALQMMISADSNRIIRNAFTPNLINMLHKSQKQTDEEINFEFLVLQGLILMKNPGFSEQSMKFINNTFLSYVNITLRLQKHLTESISTKNEQLLSKIVIILRQYTYLIRQYLKRFLFIDLQSSKLLYNENYQLMISQSLQYNLSCNTLQQSIFILPVQQKSIQIFNSIKTNTITIINSTLRILCSYVKNINLLKVNPTFIKINQYLPYIITSTASLLKNIPFYQIQSTCIFNTLQQILSLLVTALRSNYFYHIFQKYQKILIENCIFTCLIFTTQDYNSYYFDSEQFINRLLQIIQRQTTLNVSESNDEIKIFTTLKTYTADFLHSFCKYQDGALTEIFNFALKVISYQKQSQISFNVLMLVLCILRDQSKSRIDLHQNLYIILMKLFQQLPFPKKSTQQPESKLQKDSDIQYSMALLVLSCYSPLLLKLDRNIVDRQFKLVYNILKDQQVEQVPKIISLNIINNLNHLQQGEIYSQQILILFNNLLKNKQIKQQQISLKLLDGYFSLFKYNDHQLLQKIQLVSQTINLLAHTINIEISNNSKQKLIINKCWNIIRHIGQNPQFISSQMITIENTMLLLIVHINGINNLDYQQDILLLMTSFIQKNQIVNQNQLKMFEIIPKIFYNQYNANFGHAYQTLQIFIYYGKNALINSSLAINLILEMCLTSLLSTQYKGKALSQADNCQGVLILQSLILSCGESFNKEIWMKLIQAINRRLNQNLKCNLFKANLIACLSLILVYANNILSYQESDQLLSIIFKRLNCFTGVKYAGKVLIVALSECLVLVQREFVSRHFVQILDITISMLELNATSNNENIFGDEDECNQQRDYSNSLQTTTNYVTGLDQFQFFKTQIQKINQNYSNLLQSSIGELPTSKKDFLREVLTVQRVMNEPRKIYKIRRNII